MTEDKLKELTYLNESIKYLKQAVIDIESAIDNPDDLKGLIRFSRDKAFDLLLNTEDKSLCDQTRQRLEELTTVVLHMYLVPYKNELQKLQKEFDNYERTSQTA